MRLNSAVRACLFAVLVGGLVAAPVVGAVGAVGPATPADGAPTVATEPRSLVAGSELAQVEPAESTNNSTANASATPPQHEKPDRVEGDRDLQALQSWLQGRMNEYVLECTGELNATQEALCAQRNESYPQWVSQYVTLSEQTDTERDDQTAQAYDEVRRTQQRYSNQTRQFEDLRVAYETARENGNETRARELARRLVDLAGELNGTSATLQTTVRAVGNNTSTDVTPVVEELDQQTTAQVAAAEEIRERELTDTRLSVSLNRTRIGFARPVRVRGVLRDETGSAVANQSIRVRVGGQLFSAETDGTGQFSLAYRPVLLSADATNLSVAYVPQDSSVYLGSADSHAVTVEQVTATTTVEADTQTVSYGESVSVTTTVAVDGVPVSDAPLDLRATGFDRNRSTVGDSYELVTGDEGVASVSLVLDSNASIGAQTLAVGGSNDTAVAIPAATTTVTVEPTATDLDVAVEDRNESTVVVAGTLATSRGTPIPNRTVAFVVGNETVGTATTSENGTFESELPSSAFPDTGTVALVTQFESDRGLLEAASATTDIDFGSESSGFPVQAVLLVVGLGVVAGGVGVGWWWRRDTGGESGSGVGGVGERVTAQSATPQSGESAAVRNDDSDSGLEAEESVSSAIEASLDDAASRIDENPESAVVVAYEAVRQSLLADFGYGSALNHTELARRVRSDGETSQADAVDDLVGIYEQVAFAPSGVTNAEASRALDLARELVESA
ncbi:hypothetical protein C455_09713 [Haloferax larsenii JCM 13917]|nr:DUF4129 domain-containing protein [Haloferax larsenii]ELZ77950.1 hypothetical protein C455_09713 [Haloferax larsenii JCM 13917]